MISKAQAACVRLIGSRITDDRKEEERRTLEECRSNRVHFEQASQRGGDGHVGRLRAMLNVLDQYRTHLSKNRMPTLEMTQMADCDSANAVDNRLAELLTCSNSSTHSMVQKLPSLGMYLRLSITCLPVSTKLDCVDPRE